MKKITWLDINSSYSHSSLAFPAISVQQEDNEEVSWSVVSGTINSEITNVVEDLIKFAPDVIAYTAWLFNHEFLLKVLSRYKAIAPNVVVIGGGPEYLGDNESYLRKNEFINYVVRGEGEEVFYHWLKGDLSACGLCYIDNNEYIDKGLARVENFNLLKYPETSIFFDWNKPFIQIESTRGCFNSCSFCVSGADKPIREISISELRKRLQEAQKHGIRDIRLLDRTFNGKGRRTVEMLDLFSEFKDSLHFHIEVHPALLSTEIREKIKLMPKGLLHIEAGVQSLSQKVLDASLRFGAVEDVIDGLKFISSLDGMELHADLIIGLPFYTKEMVYSDVNELVKIGCDEIQVELLKMLPGTQMRNNKGIRYSPDMPYEVLETDWANYVDIQESRRLSRIIDLYYNCKYWQKSTKRLIEGDSNFLKNLTMHLYKLDMCDTPMSQEKRGVILYDYCVENYPEYLVDVVVDWLNAGLSLRKGAGKDAILQKNVTNNNRIYCIEINDKRIFANYDKSISQSFPISVTIEELI